MHIVSEESSTQSPPASAQSYDVVVVGAGPFGLSAAAHLAGKNLKVATFGKPMEAWRAHMPKGMFLRSEWQSTNLSDPEKKYGLKQFFQASQYGPCHPLPIEAFIDYGLWFQEHVVSSVDETYVSSVESTGERFLVTLEDGRTVITPAVVMAVGPGYYQYIPSTYAHLPSELLTHSSVYGDLGRFAGQRVAIIGGGQSGIEWAALLNEAGASVSSITRRPIRWHETHGEPDRTFLQRVRAPYSGIAPGWRFLAMEKFPYTFQRFPLQTKEELVHKLHWPAASLWLKDRILGKVALHEGRTVQAAAACNSGVQLTLSDGSQMNVDHVISATGYRANVSQVGFLSPTLTENIKTYQGSPVLNPFFESSVPGLYFIGFSSLLSFGPLYRFVAGAPASARRIAQAVARRVTKTR